MFVSKFWTLLLALVTGAMLAVIILARDVINRERVENATAILYKEMTKVDISFKLHARNRLDVLLALAVDPEIRKHLASASLNNDRAVRVRDPLRSVLRKNNNKLGKYSADLLIAVDMSGIAVAQVGYQEREHSYSLAGFPLVDAALRGYLRDDVWKLSNDLYLMAARPVIDQGRYVGALVHGMKVSDQLASEISPSVQLAFFAGNTMIAVGKAAGAEGAHAQGSQIAKPLDEVMASDKYKKDGYSEVFHIDAEENSFVAVYSKMRGEAGISGVGFSLVQSLDTLASPTEIYENASKQDVDAVPLVWIIIGIVVVAGFGWLWNYLEGQRPVKKLLVNIQALEKSDPKDQLNIYRFRRRFRKIAAAINSLIDFKIRALIETSSAAPKSIDSILGSQSTERLSSASFKFVDDVEDDEVPPPPPPASPANAGPAIGLGGPPPNQRIPGPPAQRPPSPGAAPQPGPPAAPTPIVAGGAAIQRPMSPEEEQVYFNQIYGEFIALKKQLGEPYEQLTFDRFLGTLKKNRDTLMARYNCAQVRFQVYEKDGKASLKATPVKA